MATTSGNLVAGKMAIGGRGRAGQIGKVRVAAALATAALGFSLLAGGGAAQGRQVAAQAAMQPSAVSRTADVPSDASVSATFRWDFGQERQGVRPADAAVAADYRWDFGGAVPVSSLAVAARPGEPLPADASTSVEYRWDFDRAPAR